MQTTGPAPLLRKLPSPVRPSPLDQPTSPRVSVPESLRAVQAPSLGAEREKTKEAEVPKSTPKVATPDTKAVDKPVEPPSEPPSKGPSEPPSKEKTKEPELEESQEDEDDKHSDLELINMETFSQILELDEDEDDHDFSRPMVYDYFEQAEKTFDEMDQAHERGDLLKLSHLGHFLKGSSAALGLARVQKSCEMIQHYGQLRDEVGDRDLKPAEALDLTSKLLKRVKKEYIEAQKWLQDFYGSELEGDV